MDAEGVLLGRINYWTNEGNWTDWQGREVSNTHYSYNFHDGDWNYFGSSGGYSRKVAFEAGDERWDGTVVTEAVEVLDETGTDVRYRVENPGEGLNPGDALLKYLNVDWSDIVEINFGSNTWKQLDTNGATRDEEYTSSNREVELFVQGGEGDNTWSEYAGRLEYRDGFIEIRDSEWNEVARVVDPDNPNALTWSDLTAESSTSYVEGLEAAWDKIGDYLPSALRDNADTSDVDERSKLLFAKNQWDDLNVFTADGAFVARIDSWEHSHSWETSHEVNGEWVDGYTYNTGATFNFNDENWNHLARAGTEQHYFLSKAVIDEHYDGVRPADFSKITDPAHVILLYNQERTGSALHQEELDAIWDGVIQDAYGIPTAAQSLKGIWSWSDVTSLFVEEETQTYYATDGVTVVDENTNKRVQYDADGFWWDGQFTLRSAYDAEIHGEDTNALNHARDQIGVVEYRDGFIEVRDGNWNTLGRFADASSADGFDKFASDYTGLEAAWDAVADYFPAEWSVRKDLLFSADSNDNILVMDAEGVLLGRINAWIDISVNGSEKHESVHYNFMSSDYENYASSGSYKKIENGVVRYLDENLGTSYDVIDVSEDLLADISPIANDAGVSIENIQRVWINESEQKDYAKDGSLNSVNTYQRIEYFGTNHEFLGVQEKNGGITTLYDFNWEIVSTAVDIPDGTETAKFGANVEEVLVDSLMETFGSEIANLLLVESLDVVEAIATDNYSIILVDESANVLGKAFIRQNGVENGNRYEWSFRLEDKEGRELGQFEVRHDYANEDILKTPNSVDYGRLITSSDAEWDALMKEARELPSDLGFSPESVIEIWHVFEKYRHQGDTDYRSHEHIRYISGDENGFRNWDYFSLTKEAGTATLKDLSNDEVVYQTVTGELSAPDFLGVNTVEILENWLSVYKTQVEKTSGMTGDWSLMQTAGGSVVLLLGEDTLAVGKANVNDPNSEGEVYWNVEFDSLGAGISGWNQITDLDGVLSTAKNGVQFYSYAFSDDQEFESLLSNYTPPNSVDITGSLAENFDFAAVDRIQYSIWSNDNEGDGDYSTYVSVNFIPSDGTGGADWKNKISVEQKGEQYILRDADGNPTGISWIDPNIELNVPDFLGVNTVSILQSWLNLYQTKVEKASGMSGDWTLMQTAEGAIALLLDDQIVTLGQARVENPNSNDEVHWEVHFESLAGAIGGWNRTTDTNGVLSTTEKGARFSLDEHPGDKEFDDLVSKFAPPSTLDLIGTAAENFDFKGAVKIQYEIWSNDFDGDGNYETYDLAKFIPDDGTGGTDWDNKIEVVLRDGIFKIRDSSDNVIEEYFVEISSDDTAQYSDYTRYSEILDKLLGTSNIFTKSEHELLNSTLVGIDFNEDGLNDAFIQGAYSNNNLQTILDPKSLEIAGALYQDDSFDFVRLPSDFSSLKSWVAELEFGTSVDESMTEIAEAILLEINSLMSRNLDAQLQFWESSTSSEKSVGIRFMEDNTTVGSFWITDQSTSLADFAETPYKVTIQSPSYKDTGLGNALYLASDIYTPSYSALIGMIDLDSKELAAKFDLNLSSDAAFANYDEDVANVNGGFAGWLTPSFVGGIRNLYDAQFVATDTRADGDNTLVMVSANEFYEHYMVFNSAVSPSDVNNALSDPGSHRDVLSKFTGIKSYDLVADAFVSEFEFIPGEVSIKNISGGDEATITALKLGGAGFMTPLVLRSAVEVAYQFVTNNSDKENRTYRELLEDSFVELGFDTLSLTKGDNTLMSVKADSQETADSSVILTFDDSTITASNEFSNISDIMGALYDLGSFDPLSAVLLAAEQNAVETGVKLSVDNGDLTLLSIDVSDAAVLSNFDADYLLTEENMTQNTDGFTFTDPNEDIEFNILVDPTLEIADIAAILEADII